MTTATARMETVATATTVDMANTPAGFDAAGGDVIPLVNPYA